MKRFITLLATLVAAMLSLAQTQTGKPGPYPYLRPDAAYISPAEFAATFGGRLVRAGERWEWSFDNRTFSFDTRLNKLADATTGYDLPGPPHLRDDGVVVVPASAVRYVASCRIERTLPLDATVRVTCGAKTANLKRY